MLASRKWFWALGLIVALGTAPARAAEVGKYVPADAEMVMHIDVQQLLSSGLVKKYALPHIKQALMGSKEAQQLFTAIGLDPLKDVTAITASNAGQAGDKVLVALHGKFDLDRIQKTAEAVAKEKKGDFKITRAGGKTIYEGTKDGKTISMSFVDGSTLVVSSNRDYVTAALAGKSGKPAKALQDAVSSIEGKRTLWFAAVVTDQIRKQLAKNQQGALAEKLKAVTGGVTVNNDLAASVTVRTSDKEAANQLSGLAQFGKGMIANNEQVPPVLQDVLKGLTIKTLNTDVSIDLKVSQETIEKVMKMLPGQ
jgi:hypothetical protein